MRVLIIGTGAREHALAAAIASDPAVTALHAAPGNPGIGEIAELHAVDPEDGAAVTALASEIAADLVVIGPEAPLVAGVADALAAAGIAVFGPRADAALLEGSKAFAKEIMAAADVPTAAPVVARTVAEAEEALDRFGAPHVVKADGLAAGKGVVVTHDRDEALAHASACLEDSDRVVIEEFLDGPEVSLFVLCDGTTALPLEPAQDFKRIGDGDLGPNTGGMGAYSPLPWAPEGLVADIVARVAQPTVDELARRGTPFTGVLYCGLALTSKGLKVIEFNVRFGDPETQSVLARLVTPLGGVLMAAAEGRLAEIGELEWTPDAAVTVVQAAGGYPASPRRDDAITGIEAAREVDGVQVLHAGTRTDETGTLLTAGGRVLSVVGTGTDLSAARARAYAGVKQIVWDGEQHRSDIAARAAEGGVEIPHSYREAGA